eukprot:TRINITY_DN3539_c0_g1_i3.p1 TRINITY_DN3539_c0_g1~~TRINITY_DN3539_c0_g1_i3.p1  ORF type:complete len:137 (-),score=13.59 TRINITY_DN3539_c0_g1_i3:145-555(-)
MNWYADGEHHVGWHSDSEDDLVDGAAIASLSLGETRTFQLRHRSDSEMGKTQQELCAKAKQGVELTAEEQKICKAKVGTNPELNMQIEVHHGDLVIMRGQLQKHWRHRVPQVFDRPLGPRICFTFRQVANDRLQIS